MKKLFLFLTLLGAPHLGMAANIESYNLGSSSYIATNEGPVRIPNTRPGTVLLYVAVGTASAGGTLRIYDSSGVASGQIANITLGTVGFYRYDVVLSSALTYTSANATNGVTLIYKKTR
jgi:hypothetical protein